MSASHDGWTQVGDRARPAARVREPPSPPSAPAGGILYYASLSPPPPHPRTSARPRGIAETVHLTGGPTHRSPITLGRQNAEHLGGWTSGLTEQQSVRK